MEKKNIKVAAANKILTVVIPTYNMEKYLRRCLDSLIESDQQMQMLEVLVINDGSKDSSSQIAHEYQDRYPQTFRVIDKENGNYGSCVNRGLKEATGKYFRLLDADDQFRTESLMKFIDILLKTDADMVLTHHCFTFDGNNKKVEYQPRSAKIKYGEIYAADDFDFEELGCDKTLLLMHSITYKLEILRKVGLRHQTGISYTDTEFVYFPLVAVKNILPVDIYLYAYTRGRDGQTVSQIAKGADAYFKVGNRIFQDFIENRHNKTNSALRKKQSIIVMSRLKAYIHLELCLTKKNAEHNNRLLVMYDNIQKNIPELLSELRADKFKHLIHYFTVWEHTGKYMSDYPYCILGNSVDFIKRIIYSLQRK